MTSNNNVATSAGLILKNFSDFANSHSGNVSGVKVSMSIKDCQGNWHTLSQRLFKNGSIHIIALIVVISILLVIIEVILYGKIQTGKNFLRDCIPKR